MSPATIRQAASPDDLALLREVFRAYADWLAEVEGHDLDAGGFAAELAGLPGPYAPPRGALLLARSAAGAGLGCVALRDLGHGTAEIKRLFVAPEARGQSLGRRLAEAAVAAAREAGYRRVVLDSLPGLAAARALYRDLGFRDIAPYHDARGLVFMGRDL